MKLLSVQTLFALAFTTSAGVVVLIAACGTNSAPSGYDNNVVGSSGGASGGSGGSGSSGGSSSSGAGSGSSSGSTDDGGGAGMDAAAMLVTYDGPPPNVDGGMILCATPDGLPIKFNPVYSGYDGVHSYQVPVFVVGANPGSVTWGSSDPTMVSFQPYVTGIMITTRKAGDVTIVARIGSMCGTAPLHITQFSPDDWTVGNARYNNGNPLNFSADAAGIPSGFDAAAFDASSFDGSFDAQAACTSPMFANLTNPFENPPAQCTNCHGSMSNGTIFGMTVYSDVEHTPEQTGGFSDSDFINVFVTGTIPDGGYFESAITPYCLWHKWHQWRDINTDAGQTGMLSYLRSLTPQEQLGCFDLFNAKMCADGG
jgi:hypothetical protein